MFDKKALKKTMALGMSAIVILSAGLLPGCAAKTDRNGGSSPSENNNKPAIQEEKQDKIMPEFIALIGENPKPDALIEFIDKNISAVPAEDASRMLAELEKAQKDYLPILEDKYITGENSQDSLGEIFKEGFDLDEINNMTADVKDPELKSLLEETRSMGYKVETAEGMFFPVIDYEFLKKYSSYVTEDMKEYINIMAVETNRAAAKDAALVISWDEVIERALAQESFIKRYESSAKLESVRELQKKYIRFILYGLNNTPLFSYDKKTMNSEAKKAYLKAIKENGDSELIKMLSSYMEILERSNYRLTDEVENFRKKAAEE